MEVSTGIARVDMPATWKSLARLGGRACTVQTPQKSEGIIVFGENKKCIALRIMDIMESKRLMVWRSRNHPKKRVIFPSFLEGPIADS